MYMNFIGWVPIILAVIALRLVPRQKMRLLIYFLAAIVWVLLTSSAVTFRWLAPQFGFISSIRYASVIGGLAVPLVLALAGWGLHLLFKLNWPRIAFWLPGSGGSQTARSFRIHYLVLAIPLLWSIEAAYTFKPVAEIGTNESGRLYCLANRQTAVNAVHGADLWRTVLDASRT